MPINPTTENDYRTKTQEFLADLEGDVRRIYTDGNGIPHMGIGFALFHRKRDSEGNPYYEYRGGSQDALNSELQEEANVTLNKSDLDTLDQALDDLNSGKNESVQESIPQATIEEIDGSYVDSSKNSFSFTLDETQVDDLFEVSLAEAEGVVEERLGQYFVQSLENSREKMALTSLAFNVPGLVGSGLTTAIHSGNRTKNLRHPQFQTR